MSASDTQGLLAAVARWIDDARPALQDPALAFRARIAAALLRSIAAESAAAESLEVGELARLSALVRELDHREDVEDPADGGTSSEVERRAALRTLERVLCDRVRAGLDAGALARVRATVREGLRARLAVTTPDFDLSAEVE